MKTIVTLLGGAAIACLSLPAWAQSVTATLSATYFEVDATTGGPDFGGSGYPNVALGSSLGPDGLPVATSPFGVSEVDPTTDEITWWSPALNSAVIETGTGTISLPYGSNMYAPNSTGTNDYYSYETAFFKGTFNLASSEAVEFNLGSDDDSFIYVNGKLIGQNPGIHGVSNVNFTSPTLNAGANSIEVFYDDREDTGAYLSLSLVTSGVTISPGVPEPSTWAMMLLGFAGLGFAAYRKGKHGSTALMRA